MTKDPKTPPQPSRIDESDLDSFADETRRALLKKIALIGGSAAPASVVLLDATKARADTGSTIDPGGGGGGFGG